MLSSINSKAHHIIFSSFSNNNSPKNGINTNYDNILDSPKSNNFTGLNTNGSNRQIPTNNSRSLNYRKFTSVNMPTNSSKAQSINSSSSKLPVSTYISCSTLQSGVASYSIPKTKRFKNSYNKAYCDSIYNLPDYKSTHVSIGNSTRKDLFDRSKGNIPSPQDYMFSSLFEDNLNKNKGSTISIKLNSKDETINFPGPADYDKGVEWKKQSPCTLKFRKNYFYEEESKRLHDVSPMKYLPDRKVTENGRFKNYGIGIGLGRRSNDQYNNMKITPGPGDYHLPSLFEKRIQGKYPLN